MSQFKLAIAAGAVLILGTQAQAADIARPVYKAPVVAPAFNWSGFYVGGHAGWGWGKGDGELVRYVPPVAGAAPPIAIGTVRVNDRDGFLGGAQVGFNWQAPNSPWVLGIEADGSWTDASTQSTVAGAGGLLNTTLSDTNWYASITGRIGYAWGMSLLYVKGGAGFMDVDYQSRSVAGGGTFLSNAVSDTRSGWLIGAGFEQAIASGWSWKVEYNYIDFASETYSFTTTTGAGSNTATNDLTEAAHLVKVGVNFRFGAH